MDWIGKKVRQVRCEAPEFRECLGRIGTVDKAFVDERGQTHVRTAEDEIWCPARLVEIVQ